MDTVFVVIFTWKKSTFKYFVHYNNRKETIIMCKVNFGSTATDTTTKLRLKQKLKKFVQSKSMSKKRKKCNYISKLKQTA